MKFALVTGASSGIGLEYVKQLASKGKNVIIVSNRKDDNERIAEDIGNEYGVIAVPLYVDLSDSDAAEMIYMQCRNMNAEVDTLISNAGILHFGRLVNSSANMPDKIIAIHCTTPVKLCKLFAKDMCDRREGRILLMSSMTAWTPYPTMTLYGSTKVFLRNFGQSLWYELRDYGVSVTTVFPGAVDTPLYNLDAKLRGYLCRLGIMMSPKELASKGLKSMFNGRRYCIPGIVTKLEVLLCKLLPARCLCPILKIPVIARIIESI